MAGKKRSSVAPAEAPRLNRKTRCLETKSSENGVKASISRPTNDTAPTDSAISGYRVSPASLKCLRERGIETFFEIQRRTFDVIFEGKHVIGRARTGSGKTLAFVLPTVEALISSNGFANKRGELGKYCRVLALLPTRELAQQVAETFASLQCQRYSTVVLIGGVDEHGQLEQLRQGASVIVGTPGRLTDFLRRGMLKMDRLKTVILDEADQMLEKGFIEDIDQILTEATSFPGPPREEAGAPEPRREGVQVLLFSATLPHWIRRICEKYMTSSREKEVVDVIGEGRGGVAEKQSATPDSIKHYAIMCGSMEFRALLLGRVLLSHCGRNGKCIIFTETKLRANEIATNSKLRNLCQQLHGDISQTQREITMKAFKENKFQCLVATDIAARGLDIEHVELVVQLEPPKDIDTYVHRTGRTGRAGKSGSSIMFFRIEDAPFLSSIEKQLSIKFTRTGVPKYESYIDDFAQKLVSQHANGLLGATRARRLEASCRKTAEMIVSKMGATEAVSGLLMELLDKLDVAEDEKEGAICLSLLTGKPNLQTYQVLFGSKRDWTKTQLRTFINRELKSPAFSEYVSKHLMSASQSG